MAWCARRLTALSYPGAKTFSITNSKDVRALVTWIEETKLQHWKPELRAALVNANSPDGEWRIEFGNYLQALGCRRETDDITLQLEWLLSHTLAIDYSSGESQSGHNLPPCDYNSPELKAAIDALREALHYPPESDYKLLLSILLQHLHRKFVAVPTGGIAAFSLKDADLPIGFNTGDNYLNDAATVLRLLFVQDLRDLQTRINEVIMLAQNITANPRTDLNLGKVGK